MIHHMWPLQGMAMNLVSNAAKAIKNVVPKIQRWNLKIMKHDTLLDSVSSAVHVAFFGAQILAQMGTNG